MSAHDQHGCSKLSMKSDYVEKVEL